MGLKAEILTHAFNEHELSPALNVLYILSLYILILFYMYFFHFKFDLFAACE